MARFYADENFPLPTVTTLRALGHNVVTALESGQANLEIPDESVLDFAIAERRAVLTINRRHFMRLAASRPNHPGIVVCTIDRDFVGQGRRIHEAVSFFASLEGKLLRVNRPAK